MGSINLHILCGTVGKDPVLRTTQSGKTVTEISVATSDGDKDAQGNFLTNWHKVVCFDKAAEFVGRNVGKGTVVAVQGPVKLRSFVGKDGQKVYMKETLGYKVETLTKSIRNNNPATYTPGNEAPATAGETNVNEAFPNAPVQEPWERTPAPSAPEAPTIAQAVAEAKAQPAPILPGQEVAGQEHTEQGPPPSVAPGQPLPQSDPDPF